MKQVERKEVESVATIDSTEFSDLTFAYADHMSTENYARIIAYIDARLAVGMADTREAVLEEAAKACDRLVYAIDHGDNEYRREANASRCAADIRAMKSWHPAMDDKSCDVQHEAAIRYEVERLRRAEMFEQRVENLMVLIEKDHKFDWPYTDAFDDGGIAYNEAKRRIAAAKGEAKP